MHINFYVPKKFTTIKKKTKFLLQNLLKNNGLSQIYSK